MFKDRTYGKANDKFVAEDKFYVSSGKIYTEVAHTNLAATADLEHAFEIGTLVLVDGTAKAKALAFSVSSNVATVVAVFDTTTGLASFTNAAS
jgi:hypothetical protein